MKIKAAVEQRPGWRKLTQAWPLLRKILLLGVGLALLGGSALLAVLLWQRNKDVVLPLPGGPYPVGRIEYDWSDASRIDPLGSRPGAARRLAVWIWYPAEKPSAATAPAPYLPPAWIQARAQDAGILGLLSQNPAHVHSHSFTQPALSPVQTQYPLLIFQPGLGPALPDYTALCETLASYGYIVAGSTPSGSANLVVFQDGTVAHATAEGNPPDSASLAETQRILGQLIQVWAKDDEFVLNQVAQLNAADPAGRFRGRIDLDAVGVLGHSFGGATAAQFCQLESRCKSGADLDGYPYGDVIQTGLPQPFLFLWSEPPDPQDPAWQRAVKDTQAIIQKLPPASRQIILPGTRHFNFTDAALEFNPALHLLGYLGPIDGADGMRTITSAVRAFFDETLRQQR